MYLSSQPVSIEPGDYLLYDPREKTVAVLRPNPAPLMAPTYLSWYFFGCKTWASMEESLGSYFEPTATSDEFKFQYADAFARHHGLVCAEPDAWTNGRFSDYWIYKLVKKE